MSENTYTVNVHPHMLRVVRGTHQGAEVKLAAGGFLIIGSGDDCDIVLSGDDEVSTHHCVISLADNRFTLRAVDAAVSLDGTLIDPGEPVSIAAHELIQIGTATVVLEPIGELAVAELGSQHPVDSAANSEPGVLHWPATRNALPWTIGSVAAVLLGLSFAAILHGTPDAAPVIQPTQALKEALAGSPFESVIELSESADGSVRLSGVLETQAGFRELKSLTVRSGMTVQWDVLVGEQLADAVATVLRSSGISAKARHIGDGNVEVVGQFGDQHRLMEVIESRTIADIHGLENISIVNTLPPVVGDDSAPTDFDAEAKRLVAVVHGEDPYLTTADGAIYYVGAVVPGAGKFEGIANGAVWFDSDGRLVRFDLRNFDTRHAPRPLPTLDRDKRSASL